MRERVWSPTPDDARPLPLLVAHDGSMYEELVGLTCHAGDPPCRIALLDPGDRLPEYAANPDYAAALVRGVLPSVRSRVAVAGPVIALGASLGGLAMLHAHRTYPDAFGALFLQSGSFFDPLLDPQEADRFAYFGQVADFVAAVVRNDSPVPPVPTVLTCGLGEENLANNRQLAAALRGQGYPVELVETPGGHHHDTWRRQLDPALGILLRRVWGGLLDFGA
jgi:enterochelin esterase family protein